MERKLVATP